jgi:pimeloyl-ACP methyl ester carboxylesterase
MQAYTSAELVWYLFCESEKERFQVLSKPAVLSAAKRMQLWSRCLKWSGEPRQWIQGWFNNIDIFERITRPDILDFLAWGFWGTTSSQLGKNDRQQLLFMVRELEKACCTQAAPTYRFPPRPAGQEPLPVGTYSIQPIRHLHVPLLVYMGMHCIVDPIMSALLCYHGFESYTPCGAGGSASSIEGISFSVRIHDRKQNCGRQKATGSGSGSGPGSNGTALVFIHGIGIGALPYWNLIRALMDEGPVVVAHLPFVSVRRAPVCPDIEQIVSAFSQVLAAYDLDGGCFVSHSFGTAVTSWLVQYAPHLVKGTVLMDPVVLCIHLRKLLFNFVYGEQRLTSIEGLLRSELYINNCLRRNFYWYTAALFGEDLLHLCPSVIVLSSDDGGVPSAGCFAMLKRLHQAVGAAQGEDHDDVHKEVRGQRQGLLATDQDQTQTQTTKGLHDMSVLMIEGQGHGGFLGCKTTQAKILLHTKLLYRKIIAAAGSPAASEVPSPSSSSTRLCSAEPSARSGANVCPRANWTSGISEFIRWRPLAQAQDEVSPRTSGPSTPALAATSCACARPVDFADAVYVSWSRMSSALACKGHARRGKSASASWFVHARWWCSSWWQSSAQDRASSDVPRSSCHEIVQA